MLYRLEFVKLIFNYIYKHIWTSKLHQKLVLQSISYFLLSFSSLFLFPKWKPSTAAHLISLLLPLCPLDRLNSLVAAPPSPPFSLKATKSYKLTAKIVALLTLARRLDWSLSSLWIVEKGLLILKSPPPSAGKFPISLSLVLFYSRLFSTNSDPCKNWLQIKLWGSWNTWQLTLDVF